MNVDQIERCLQKGVEDKVYPGYGVGLLNKGQKHILVGGTESYQTDTPITQKTLFDLASLSKPFATTLACLVLIKEGKFSYETKLAELLDRPVPDDKKQISLGQLLSHCSGLHSHHDFYKKLEKIPAGNRKEYLLQSILDEPLQSTPGTSSLYSDIGFILLSMIIENKTGGGLDLFVKKYVFEPMELQDICYNPKDKGYLFFAATEECPWRKRLIIGEVHDQNTYVLNGVSGQAGLFSTPDTVLYLMDWLSGIIKGTKRHPFLDQQLLKEAITRRIEPTGTCWGYGFDTPSQPGSSAGKFISANSCGHLGFTGTSFWYDFDKDRGAVLLTNRINPSIDNIKIRNFRPKFHDIFFRDK